MVYLVAGHCNLNRSDICGGDFVRYLHSLTKQYRLSEYGDVTGMDAFGFIAKQVRQQHIQKVLAKQSKQKRTAINAHNPEFDGIPIVEEMRASIPDRLETPSQNSLWNMDFEESLMPFPSSSEEVTPLHL